MPAITGNRLKIVALCPECDQSMAEGESKAHPSLLIDEPSDFSVLHCSNPECIARDIYLTIERKTGKILWMSGYVVYNYNTEEREVYLLRTEKIER